MAGSQVRRRRFEFCRCHRMGPNPFLECPTCVCHLPNAVSLLSYFRVVLGRASSLPFFLLNDLGMNEAISINEVLLPLLTYRYNLLRLKVENLFLHY